MEPAMMKFTGILFFFIIFLLVPTTKSVAQTYSEKDSVVSEDSTDNDLEGYEDNQRGADQYYRNELYDADFKLNKIYKEVLDIYKEDSLFIKKLKVAQRAWIVFRDAHLNSLYSIVQDTLLASGYGFTDCISSALTDIIETRTDQLKVWLEGFNEKLKCPDGHSNLKSKEEIEKIKKSMRK
jgi:uncharacterized protein YecT (DUF1311 family)